MNWKFLYAATEEFGNKKIINSCPNNFKIGMENLYGLALVHAKFSNDRILIIYFYPASRD